MVELACSDLLTYCIKFSAIFPLLVSFIMVVQSYLAITYVLQFTLIGGFYL